MPPSKQVMLEPRDNDTKHALEAERIEKVCGMHSLLAASDVEVNQSIQLKGWWMRKDSQVSVSWTLLALRHMCRFKICTILDPEQVEPTVVAKARE